MVFPYCLAGTKTFACLADALNLPNVLDECVGLVQRRLKKEEL